MDWPPPGVELPEPTRLGEAAWLEPYPDVLLEGLADAAPGPEARYEATEAISVAFVTALQLLPPRLAGYDERLQLSGRPHVVRDQQRPAIPGQRPGQRLARLLRAGERRPAVTIRGGDHLTDPGGQPRAAGVPADRDPHDPAPEKPLYLAVLARFRRQRGLAEAARAH